MMPPVHLPEQLVIRRGGWGVAFALMAPAPLLLGFVVGVVRHESSTMEIG